MKLRGFTLIETLLTLAIASVLISVIAGFVLLLLDNRLRTEIRTDVEFQGIQTMERLLATVRQAEAVISPAVGVSAESMSIDVLDNNNDPTTITWGDNTLWMREGGDPPIALTSRNIVVSSVSFEYRTTSTTPGHVYIEFTLAHANPSGRAKYAYIKTFYGSASMRSQ